MAYKNMIGLSSSDDGKYEMNMEEFKKWLKIFDADNDGRISETELRQAIRTMGGWSAIFRARARVRDGLKCADKNKNGYVDEDEITSLKDFALKNLGVRIVTY